MIRAAARQVATAQGVSRRSTRAVKTLDVGRLLELDTDDSFTVG
jgi:hypothetical protein